MKKFKTTILKILIASIVSFILGCSVDTPTEPLPSFGLDIVTASTTVTSAIDIIEGQTAVIPLSFDRKTKAQAFVSWEIQGGMGRFLKPTGVLTVPAGTDLVNLELESYKNDTIEPVTEFNVTIASDSFLENVTAIIRITDTTIPAALSFVQDDPFQFATTAVMGVATGTLVVKNTGGIAATSISATTLGAPFRYTGGAYPGTGGTCGSYLKPGSSCSIKVEAMMSSAGTATAPLVVSYNNGSGAQSITMNLNAASDSVIASLTGLPDVLNKTLALNVTVGGATVLSYKYKVGVAATTNCADTLGYSTQTLISSNITSSLIGLSDGLIKLCVIGFNGTAWQSEAAATFATWTKDTTPPQNITIRVDGFKASTNTLAVNLEIGAEGAQYMYITNVIGCNSGGTWEIFSETRAWTLNYSNSVNRVFAKFRDRLGNETACTDDDIIHDNIPPTIVLNQNVLQADPTLIAPILYDLDFSEKIDEATLVPEIIDQKGTAKGVSWAFTKVTDTHWKLEAVSVDVGGTVMPSIVPNRVKDPANNFAIGSVSIDNSVVFNVVEFFFKDLALGQDFTCGTSTEGKHYCWGNNSFGQLGGGAAAGTLQLRPFAVDLTNYPAGFSKIYAGYGNACGVPTGGGGLYCWGDNSKMQIGFQNPGIKLLPTKLYDRDGTFSSTDTPGVRPLVDIDAIEVAIGKGHACALIDDGKISCWGNNTYGELGGSVNFGNGIDISSISYCTPNFDEEVVNCWHTSNGNDPGPQVKNSDIPGSKGFISIVSGESHVCVLAADGKVYCWGRGDSGQLGNGTNISGYTAVTVATGGISGFTGFKQITAGQYHTCGLAADGKAYCWGKGDDGQLGNTAFGNSNTPVEVNTSFISGFSGFISLKAGNKHTCGLSADSAVYCWGSELDGRLGSTQAGPQAIPRLVTYGGQPLKNVISLEVGGEHSCVILADGKAACWGNQTTDGRLGNNSPVASTEPVAIDVSHLLGKRAFRTLSGGLAHNCAVNSEGRIYCWGRGDEGQMGSGYDDRKLPNLISTTELPGGVLFKDVAAGGGHSCGLTSDGKAYCWGKNNEGQLGNNTNVDSVTPVAVDTANVVDNSTTPPTPNFKGFIKITAGGNHTCALHVDGKAYCWGYGLFGQLGRNTPLSYLRPIEVLTSFTAGMSQIKDIEAGDLHTCAVTVEGKMYCWGYGSLGRLGNNTTTDRFIPTAVVDSALPSTARAISISAGHEHTCAVMDTKDGAYCWGNGTKGQLGNNNTQIKLTPVALDMSFYGASFGTWTTISSGKEHNCGVDNRNVVRCWGEGTLGRIGDGFTLFRVTPVYPSWTNVLSNKGSTFVSVGGVTSCSIGFNGEQYCWGEGYEGKLGNDDTHDQVKPIKIIYP